MGERSAAKNHFRRREVHLAVAEGCYTALLARADAERAAHANQAAYDDQ